MKIEYTPKILIIEDNMIIAADISVQLDSLGYEVIGINTRAEDALITIKNNVPDIVLMDIFLSGKMTGIELAIHLKNTSQVPVIFISANTNEKIFKQAIQARPYAFIAKPFRKMDLKRAILITLNRISIEKKQIQNESRLFSIKEDSLFIKNRNKLIKQLFREILFLKAERAYCKIITVDRELTVSMPLNSIEKDLSKNQFARVHRSFIVNLNQIDTISENKEYFTIQNHIVPISRRRREEVDKWFRMI